MTMVDIETINYVFISHRHADHLNLPLVRYFITAGKMCFLPQGVADKIIDEDKLNPVDYDNVTIFDNTEEETFICGNTLVTAVPQKHWDIVNYAYVIEKDDHRILYSTDLDTLSPSRLGKGLYHLEPFDIIFLEGNYDEEWLKEYIVTSISILDDGMDFDTLTSDELNTWVPDNYHQLPRDMSAGLFRAVQNMRHLSKQKARSYVKDHLKTNGKYYEIHRSSMFYERPNNWDENADLLNGEW